VDENGSIVPRGTSGELCTKGYSVMKGYYGNVTATHNVIKDGWMHSGDLAVMDTEGFVSIVGRIKDIIIRGGKYMTFNILGENIYPREIEECLHEHNSVAEAQVIGVPCDYYGERVAVEIR
jgi:fatty-acyl-CoA synthase